MLLQEHQGNADADGGIGHVEGRPADSRPIWKYRKSTTAPKTQAVDHVAERPADDQRERQAAAAVRAHAGAADATASRDAGRQCTKNQRCQPP
jgi:hypothetical protein